MIQPYVDDNGVRITSYKNDMNDELIGMAVDKNGNIKDYTVKAYREEIFGKLYKAPDVPRRTQRQMIGELQAENVRLKKSLGILNEHYHTEAQTRLAEDLILQGRIENLERALMINNFPDDQVPSDIEDVA